MIDLKALESVKNPLQLKKIARENGIDVADLTKAAEIKAKIFEHCGFEDIESEVIEAERVETEDSVTFTYVGRGADTPGIIKYMGKITFVRGEALEIQKKGNEKIIQKLSTNPAFIQGTCDREELLQKDQEAKQREAEIVEKKLAEAAELERRNNK